jgi:hypothetical protein
VLPLVKSVGLIYASDVTLEGMSIEEALALVAHQIIQNGPMLLIQQLIQVLHLNHYE